MYLDLGELLEQSEKEGKANAALVRAEAARNGVTDTQMGGTTPVKAEPVNEDHLKTGIKREIKQEKTGSLSPAQLSSDPRRLGYDSRYRDRARDVDRPRSSKDRYISEREENDDRRTRRAKGSADEGTPNGGSDKDSANGSVRSRHRSRSPRPGSRRNDHRSRDRFGGGDNYRPGGPGFFIDTEGDPRHDRHYRPGGDRHPRERDDRHRSGRDRGDRDRDRGRDSHGDRGGRERSGRDSHGGHRRKTPEPTDDERDRRTVFVQQLAARLRSRDLKEFFEQVGEVVEAQIVKDRVSGRSKGVGYVEFKVEDSVQKAIQLTGQKLLGIPIIAQLTEAEKNRQARTTEGTATQSNGIPFHRLYVGNIHFSVTEGDLKNVFEPFGKLEFVQLQKEEAGRSKGYGFVQFTDPAQAKEALEKMNGFEIAGRPIRVGLGNDKFTPESTQNLLQRFGSQAHAAQFQGSQFSGMGGRGAHAGGTGNFDRPAPRDVDKTGGASALDDSDVGGVNFSNYSRDALMRKLARTDEPEPKIAPKPQAKKPVIEPVVATRCVLIKNMYDLNKETEPEWQKELKSDVKQECEDKYGKVVHIDLALDNDDGEVYVKFEAVKGGENAYKGLNGRYFGGRMLTAQYVVDAVYHMNFPKAANV